MLYHQWHEQLVGVGIALYESDALQGVELVFEQGEVVDGFFHRATLAGEVVGLVAGIGLFVEQFLGMLDDVGLIAEVMHIGIEMGAANDIGGDADHRNDHDSSYQGLLPIEGVVVDAVDETGEGSCGL